MRVVPNAAALACLAAACGGPGSTGAAAGGAGGVPDAATTQIDAAAADAGGAREDGSTRGDDAGDGSPERTFLELDCRPRLEEIGQFESHCDIIDDDPMTMRCNSRDGQRGHLFMYVHRPADAIAGVLLPLAGTNPVVTVSVGVELSENLVQSSEGGTGYVLFDSFGGDRFMRGRFLVASIQTAQTPSFSCAISEQQFVAE